MVCLTEPEENTDEDKVRITGFGLVSPVYLKPIVVDVKPLSVIHGTSSRYKYGNWDEFIALRAGLMVFPESFDSADFGALPGFKSSRDILFTWGVVLDLDPLFPKRANPPAPSVPGTPGAKP
jgi:hypothetical protein